ncbi:hypothetical protein RIF29_28262 [Crotalaria pallida]|uniref:Histidine-containing phosphotransfer protein n=1 Tax=Crotalaria pallida TaxID=3830 RepID=A0AAN9HZK1_CROPI
MGSIVEGYKYCWYSIPATAAVEAKTINKLSDILHTDSRRLCGSEFEYLILLSFLIIILPGKLVKTGLPLWMLGFGADLLWADMNRLLAFLFHQGVLDEQFLQLQQLQDETSPNFVSEVVNIYFHESEKLLTNLRGLLMEREFSDYKKVGIHLNQFMGSSSSIGAKRVTNVCVAFRAAAEQSNRAGCLRAMEILEHEYCYLKNKLHELFQMEQQRALAAGVRYPGHHQHYHHWFDTLCLALHNRGEERRGEDASLNAVMNGVKETMAEISHKVDPTTNERSDLSLR